MPPQGERLLVAVFIFSAARSGSTLLRAILGSHSRLYAPPEVPLDHLRVRAETRWIQTSMKALKLATEDLDHMLWDYVLADALTRSGKPTIVAKTPSNVLIWRGIAKCWPDARFIFLLRHPVAAVTSLHASWDPAWFPGESGGLAEATRKGLRYMAAVDEARRELPGATVRYEDLTADPEDRPAGCAISSACRSSPPCSTMVSSPTTPLARGLGDTSEKIRSGSVQPSVPAPRPADIPAALTDMCASWGYLDAAVPDPAAGPSRTP